MLKHAWASIARNVALENGITWQILIKSTNQKLNNTIDFYGNNNFQRRKNICRQL